MNAHVVLVTWRDAFLDQGLVLRERVKDRYPRGLPVSTVGFLINDDGETIAVSKDWMAGGAVVRDVVHIRKCDILQVISVPLVATVGDEAIDFDGLSHRAFKRGSPRA